MTTRQLPDPMTWTALLAYWMDLARAARAFDAAPTGPWQQAMPALITFEALARCLPHIQALPVEERAVALDKAGVLLEARRADVEDAFDMQPDVLAEADASADAAIAAARQSLTWTLFWEGPGPLRMPEVLGVPARATDDGAVAIMAPGTLAVPGTPVAWWQGRDEPMLARGVGGCRAVPLLTPLQVWRAYADDGLMVEDRVRCVDDEAPEGAMPLLVPLLVGGSRLEPIVYPDGWPPRDEATLGGGLPPVRWDTQPV